METNFWYSRGTFLKGLGLVSFCVAATRSGRERCLILVQFFRQYSEGKEIFKRSDEKKLEG